MVPWASPARTKQHYGHTRNWCVLLGLPYMVARSCPWHFPLPKLSRQDPERSQECGFKYPDLDDSKAFDGGCEALRHMSHTRCQQSVTASLRLPEHSLP